MVRSQGSGRTFRAFSWARMAAAPVRLQPAADGEDGPLQLGWDALGDVVGGVRQVIEALDAGLEVAAPPLVEPELGSAEGLADVLDRAALDAEGDGTLACRELVVHG